MEVNISHGGVGTWDNYGKITENDLINAQNQFNLVQNKFNKRINIRKKHLHRLAKEYAEGNLVFILGSGVCLRNGLPDWNLLLQRLLLKIEFAEIDSEIKSEFLSKIFNNVFKPNQLMAARYIKKHSKNKELENSVSFEELVRKTLYEGSNQYPNPFYEEILQFCVGHRDPKIDSIITYNYDDILENHFSAKGIPYCSIYKEGAHPSRREFPIYHVHGFLPKEGELPKDCGLILSEDMYHHRYTESYNWSNLLQINKFADKTCLFMGFSLEDPNSRRLLDIAAKQRGNSNKTHYIIKKKIGPEKIETRLRCLLEDDKLFDEKVQQRFKFIDLVQRMIFLQEKFLEDDALSFGIETIWIDDYEEIPDLLRIIRKD